MTNNQSLMGFQEYAKNVCDGDARNGCPVGGWL
jgi:hypothetical protein